MSTWAIKNVDFRSLISFKNHLFDSAELDQLNCIPMSEYRRIQNCHDDAKIRNEVCGTDDTILRIIKAEGRPLHVDLNSFSDLVDLYVYYPVKESAKN